MTQLKKLFISLILVSGFAVIANSQVLDAPPRDNFYDKIWIEEKTPVELPYVREVEVQWARTIWQVIDMREKINQPLYYPVTPIQNRRSLMQVIYDGIREGAIIAYEDDEFTTPLTPEEIQEKLQRVDIFENPETGELEEIIISFRSEEVTKFRIKEVWFVDSKRSMLDVRVLGISPIRQRDISGLGLVDEPLFWVYYPHCRNIFVNAEVFNRHNDAQRISFDDLFLRRMYNSYIYKESNVYDRTIAQYYQGLDALLEAERIKNDIRNWEIDLWEY
ncbi:MAG: gliding motility protein GldN [Bacteroidetes bacterium]|nr:gliding motility protein GldN [Bacteroidota bacterium]